MADSLAKRRVISYKPEVTIGVAVTGTGGYEFRKNAGGGMTLSRAIIAPGEVRSDGLSSMGRLGSKSVALTYPADGSVGTFDPLIEAGMLTTASTLSITAATASLVSITSDATSFVANGSGWLTAGMRVGDVFRITGHLGTTNNSKNLTVTAVTTLTLSVAETLEVNSTADTSFTINRGKKFTLAAGGTPTRRSFTFDEYDTILDVSKVATGCRVSSLKVTGQPDGMAIFEFGLVGMDMTPIASGSSPTLQSPTLTSTVALTWLDATIRVGGTARTNLTSFEFTWDLSAATLPVIGSSTSPDVFENNATLNGTVSGTLRDFTDLTSFTSETEFEFFGLLVEPESEPKDYISFFIPRCKYTGFSDPQGGDGATIATLPFMAAAKGTATGYDSGMITITTSAP